jgi:hypothetical protein
VAVLTPVTVVMMHMLMDVRVVSVFFGDELSRRDACAQDSCSRYRSALDGETPERAPELFQREPGIEQRAKHHIAGRAVEAVEVQNPRHAFVYPSPLTPYRWHVLR